MPVRARPPGDIQEAEREIDSLIFELRSLREEAREIFSKRRSSINDYKFKEIERECRDKERRIRKLCRKFDLRFPDTERL